MHIIEAIDALEATNSKLDKRALIKKIMQSRHQALIDGFMRCYDTYETFGIKKIPATVSTDGLLDKPFNECFHTALDSFASREYTGHAALDYVQTIRSQCEPVLWDKFYSRVLLKNMKVGVSVTTWNKVAIELGLLEYVVPVFECQLAKDGSNLENSGEKIVEVKLDGVRVITIVKTDGSVEMFSRNGKPLENFPKIAEHFKSCVSLLACDMVFDGEVMSSSFQDLMKQVHRKSDVQTDDARLFLFDCLPLANFKEGVHRTEQWLRCNHLRGLVENIDSDNIEMVEQELVDLDTPEGKARLQVINRLAIENEYEGVMLKNPTAPYECKRSKSWLKIKPTIEVTLDIVKVEEGTGKFVGTTGALVCEGIDTGRKINVNVGSGLTDSLRDDIWNNLDKVVSLKVEVIADAITQSQDGSYSLRFPRFKTFRGFEPGEKI